MAPQVRPLDGHMPSHSGEGEKIAQFDRHSSAARAIKRATDRSHSLEISSRIVDAFQNPPVIRNYVPARPQRLKIQAVRALIAGNSVIFHDLIVRKESALLLQSSRQVWLLLKNGARHHQGA